MKTEAIQKILEKNDPTIQVRESMKALKKMHNDNLKTETDKSSQLADNWQKMGELADNLITNINVINKELPDDQKINLPEKIKELESVGIKKTMLYRCRNIYYLHKDYPHAATVFGTSLDKDKLWKALKVDADGDAGKQAKVDAYLSIVQALEKLATTDPEYVEGKNTLPVLNGEGVKNMWADFTSKVTTGDDGTEIHSKDYPEQDKQKSFRFSKLGPVLVKEYGAKLIPVASRETEPLPKMNATDIALYRKVSGSESSTDREKALIEILRKFVGEQLDVDGKKNGLAGGRSKFVEAGEWSPEKIGAEMGKIHMNGPSLPDDDKLEAIKDANKAMADAIDANAEGAFEMAAE